MKVILVLLAAFVLASVGIRVTAGYWQPRPAGNIALCIMLFFTAFGHWRFTDAMARMIPGPVPFKKELVYITGLLEILAGVALLIPVVREKAGWFLLVFFVLLLPANIYAAINKIDYQQVDREGNGLSYLWFRIPMQIALMVWVYYFAIWKG
ncbi:DoxX family protein [Flavihumibacter petaseus]|uniref:DoxX family protein n=1 Tax=Flavihumibacter petaseus NBRC 106054 TaxID=1220578 RepID=A0A0E9MVQ1_9BACT|nr:membrane protein [Flavihumibacter petaseus]GAO41205.1 hypothetical protein FPE01S_01_02170 [Flavihumibacter petaseus NBRC 106054]